MEDCITLILNGNRVEVNKEKIADKSGYFASLFSHNFRDSRNKEHIINYDIDLCTLQDFVNWVHNESLENICYHNIKTSMTKFMKGNFVALLNLLQLSVLLMADELTNDIADIIILCWLLPQKVIDIWLLAQELNVKVLQDVCLSVCLDRFEELPLSPLIKLTKDNIIQLIENVNVRSCASYLHNVRDRWMKYHMVSEIANVRSERRPKFIQGTVVFQTTEDAGKVAYVYTWNGKVLSKCVQLKSAQSSSKCLMGMQVASRGFSIYAIGGEAALGTGQFNDIIWRYCLLSRKWYYQAKLPASRRHMVAVFMKNKLFIVGGVGRHRLKLFTVDILNIHTGNWERGAEVPESFTDVPPHCVSNGKLFLLKSSLYIYYPQGNYWQTVQLYNNPAVQNVDALFTQATTLFFIGGDGPGETVLSKLNIVEDTVCVIEECLEGDAEHSITAVTDTVYEDDSYKLRYVHVADVGIMIVNTSDENIRRYLHLRSEVVRDFENFSISKLGCFDIIDPDTLYDTV